MKFTFLGTGTSHGVPVIACDCEVCRSKDPRDKRLRTSGFLQTDDEHYILFDVGPEFRIQALENQLNMAQLRESQTAQTAQILANNAAQTQALEQYLNPAPIPAYMVQKAGSRRCSGLLTRILMLVTKE